jgi:hypothetical protein
MPELRSYVALAFAVALAALPIPATAAAAERERMTALTDAQRPDLVAANGIVYRYYPAYGYLAARRLLQQFDTGCWSYSLGGVEADLHYHAYHVQLLRRLAGSRPHAI